MKKYNDIIYFIMNQNFLLQRNETVANICVHQCSKIRSVIGSFFKFVPGVWHDLISRVAVDNNYSSAGLTPYLASTGMRRIFIAGSLEAAYSLNWGAREIWGKGGGETLALLW